MDRVLHILQTYRNTVAWLTNPFGKYFVHFNYDNQFGTATCIGLNLEVRSQLLISFNMIVYSSCYEYFKVGPKINILV